jgi:hypothetical protein
MNRRILTKTMVGALSVSTLGGREAGSEEAHTVEGGFKAIAFDAFVIFDSRTVEKRVIAEVPDRGAELAPTPVSCRAIFVMQYTGKRENWNEYLIDYREIW